MARQKGYKVTEETKKKLRLIHLGKPKPWLIGKPSGMLGKHHSEESKKKMGLASLGRIKTIEERRKLSIAGSKRKLSIETRRKVGDSHRGSKSVNWKGGVTPINNRIRKSMEYNLWRTAVFERDNYTCIWGGKAHGSKLHADHIKPFCDYPELRFAIDNGRTLCVECHKKTDTYGWKNYHSKKICTI